MPDPAAIHSALRTQDLDDLVRFVLDHDLVRHAKTIPTPLGNELEVDYDGGTVVLAPSRAIVYLHGVIRSFAIGGGHLSSASDDPLSVGRTGDQ